ncbi:hypothetical protein KXD93_19905 [Mucilaginibacter sp. BJC16-A38]|uniref:hypothetical protein n=1 Tax=Mucilaginibacter phenanthrenivorans TaxID=1234842 RepID=UPI0021575175|nr:hypothetical protein [Mucilaginibacter phenanthrenivorans]MCR8559926.1 hypothetical protein [Mucilaginibacter phenanthrenivorans]
MKSAFFLIIPFLCAFQCATAQWTISGANIYNSNTGGVGIGTTTPLSLLDVKGALAVGTFAGSAAAPANGLSVSGKASFGISAPSPISAGVPMFSSVTPNVEVFTGSAPGTYEELMTIRHAGVDVTAVNRRLGLLLKMSSESSVGESGKNGGMVLESSIGYANVPSLSLVTSSTDRLTITYDGKIGMGTTAPVTALDVLATATSVGVRSISSGTLGGGSGGGLLAITNTEPNATDQRLGFLGFGAPNNSVAPLTYKYAASISGFASEDWTGGTNGSYLSFSTTTNGGTASSERMRIDNAGNISIGTTDPKGYKLAVNGSAIATALWVKLNANWPDYVFKTGYRLPALTEIKTYIDANHHLPDVPTEQDVKQNGLNLGEMNRVLLQKVEELTLYMIEQDKKLQQQQKEIDELKRKQ